MGGEEVGGGGGRRLTVGHCGLHRRIVSTNAPVAMPNRSTGLVFMHVAKRLSVVKLAVLPVQPNVTLVFSLYFGFRLSIACQSSHRSSERLVSASLFTQDHKTTLGYLG